MSGVNSLQKRPLQWEGYVTEGHVLMARARDHFRFRKGAVCLAFAAGVLGIAAVSILPLVTAVTGIGSAARSDEIRIGHLQEEFAKLTAGREAVVKKAMSDAAAAYSMLTGRYRDAAAVDKLADAPSEGEMLVFFTDWARSHQETGAAPKDWAVAKAASLPARIDASTVTELETRHGLLAVGVAKGDDGKPRPFAWLLRKGEWAIVLVDEPDGGTAEREELLERMRGYVNANRREVDDAKIPMLTAMVRGQGALAVYPAQRLGPAMAEILEDASK